MTCRQLSLLKQGLEEQRFDVFFFVLSLIPLFVVLIPILFILIPILFILVPILFILVPKALVLLVPLVVVVPVVFWLDIALQDPASARAARARGQAVAQVARAVAARALFSLAHVLCPFQVPPEDVCFIPIITIDSDVCKGGKRKFPPTLSRVRELPRLPKGTILNLNTAKQKAPQ